MYYRRTAGVLVSTLDQGWVAFSPASGETHLLSDETVAILELLAPGTALAQSQLAERLSAEVGLHASEIESTLAASWETLIAAGLVHRVPAIGPDAT